MGAHFLKKRFVEKIFRGIEKPSAEQHEENSARPEQHMIGFVPHNGGASAYPE
jgi:hypothetical protein